MFNAPKRRVDNEVSRLADAAALLQLHLGVTQTARALYRRALLFSLMRTGFALTAAVGIPAGLLLNSLQDAALMTLPAGMILAVAVTLYERRALAVTATELTSSTKLEDLFRSSMSAKPLTDEGTLALWSRVAEGLRHSLSASELTRLPRLSNADASVVSSALERDIPDIRRTVGPAYHR